MLAIFDLDGTLLNSIADLATATNYALRTAGFPTTRLLERALPEAERTPENVELLRTHFKEYYGTHLADNTVPYPGIPELLAQLRARGVNVAVASNKYQAAVDRLIRDFFPTVEWAAIEGQKEGVPVKPDPSIVFEILGKCPTPKDDVIYIGDSGVDMETAYRAGVTSIGVTWGFRPRTELEAFHPAHIVDHAKEIAAIALK